MYPKERKIDTSKISHSSSKSEIFPCNQLSGSVRFILLIMSLATQSWQVDPKFLFHIQDCKDHKCTFDCSDTNKKFIYTTRLKNTASKPLSLKLVDFGASPISEHIQDVDNGGNPKKYALFQPGPKCYMFQNPSSNHAVVFIALIMSSTGSSTNCKVDYIVSERGLVDCSGTTEDLWTAIQLNSGGSDLASFKEVKLASGFFSGHYQTTSFDVTSFDPATQMSDSFVEMMVLQPYYKAQISGDQFQSIMSVHYSQFDAINKNLEENPSESLIRPSKFIPRLIKEDLPGYFLGVYTGPSDDPEAYVQRIHSGGGRRTYTMQVQMYLSKPGSLTINKQHTASIIVKPHKYSSRNGKLAELDYSIKFTRTATHINFQAYRGSTPSASVSLPFTTSTNYVYFTFSIGQGILYDIDPSNVKAKLYEILSVFEPGTKLSDMQTYTENRAVDSLMRLSLWFDTEKRWIKVQFIPAPGVTTNEGHLRVYSTSLGYGVFPSALISSRTLESDITQCYHIGYNNNHCLAMALLDGPGDDQLLQIVDGDGCEKIWVPNLLSNCKKPITKWTCLIAKPGRVQNIELSKRKTKNFEKNHEASYYQALSQEAKDFLVEFTNDVRTKYVVSCPWSCKLTALHHSFILIFNFDRKFEKIDYDFMTISSK